MTNTKIYSINMVESITITFGAAVYLPLKPGCK